MKLLKEIRDLLREIVRQNDELIALYKEKTKNEKLQDYIDPRTGMFTRKRG